MLFLAEKSCGEGKFLKILCIWEWEFMWNLNSKLKPIGHILKSRIWLFFSYQSHKKWVPSSHPAVLLLFLIQMLFQTLIMYAYPASVVVIRQRKRKKLVSLQENIAMFRGCLCFLSSVYLLYSFCTVHVLVTLKQPNASKYFVDQI